MSEARSIAQVEERAQVIPVTGGSLMDVISRAAADPNTDVDKLERLLGMYERITAQQAKAAFTAALAEMQPRLPIIDQKGEIRHGENKPVQSRYAKYEDINEAVRPLLSEFGFALSFRINRTEGLVAITGVLSHRDGHSEETTLELPVDASGSKNGVQAVGSSVSYGKRYTAIALLNITSRAPQDRDDDGKAAGERGMSKPARDAIADINFCETAPEVNAWRDGKSAAYREKVSADEWSEIIRVFNRRVAAIKERSNV